jgi:hypothetical protein
MLRCVHVALLACAMALPAAAQPIRNFNANVLRGEMTFGQPPEVSLNGRPARLAPGSRIRGTDNLLKMSATLTGQRAVVNYTLDPTGLVLDVWLLTAFERARRTWPQSEKEARAWVFDAAAQTWIKP